MKRFLEESGHRYGMSIRGGELLQILDDEVLWCATLILLRQRRKYRERVFRSYGNDFQTEELPAALREECAGYW